MLEILQDRRYWVVHLITIPCLFIAGLIFVLSGFVYRLFGTPNFMKYFEAGVNGSEVTLINDRFSSTLFVEDV